MRLLMHAFGSDSRVEAAGPQLELFPITQSNAVCVRVASELTKIANPLTCWVEILVMPTQNVNLTTELELFVKEQVRGGNFNNASEVHRAALASMRRNEEERQARLARLRGEIQKGIESIDAGDFLAVASEEEEDRFFAEQEAAALDRHASRAAQAQD